MPLNLGGSTLTLILTLETWYVSVLSCFITRSGSFPVYIRKFFFARDRFWSAIRRGLPDPRVLTEILKGHLSYCV